MPIDIRDAETTMSMTRNGMYTTNPMMNAARSSESTNAGTSVVSGTSLGVAGLAALVALVSRSISSSRVCASMNVRSGATPSWNATVWVFWPCRYGCTPCLFTSFMVGPMMNRLRNRARPARTWFGGTEVSPRAFRTIDRTTNTFVKLVQSRRRAGATDNTVISSRMTIELLGLPFGPLIWTPTVADPGAVVALAGPTGPPGGVGAAGTAGTAGSAGTAGAAATGTPAPSPMRRPANTAA